MVGDDGEDGVERQEWWERKKNLMTARKPSLCKIKPP
jgi:hypothetical protein